MKARIPQILHWGCRVILAVMFFYTGYVKIEAPLTFAVTLAGYDLFPPEAWIPFIAQWFSWIEPEALTASITLFIAQWFPWVEIALGVFLLFDGVIFGVKPVTWKVRYVAAAATALLLFFTVILGITYFRGIDANCGCFNFTDKITPTTILRDSVILIPALYLLFERRIIARWKSAKSEESGNPENSPGSIKSDAS